MPFGLIVQQFSTTLSYIARIQHHNFTLQNFELRDLHSNNIRLAEFLDISFNEFLIQTSTNKYLYNKLSKEIFNTNGKTIISLTAESLFFKKGKIVVNTEADTEILLSSMFYLRHIVSLKQTHKINQ